MKGPSSGSIYFDLKEQERGENRRVVCFSPSKRSTLKEELSNSRSPCFPESAKGQVRTGDERIQI